MAEQLETSHHLLPLVMEVVLAKHPKSKPFILSLQKHLAQEGHLTDAQLGALFAIPSRPGKARKGAAVKEKPGVWRGTMADIFQRIDDLETFCAKVAQGYTGLDCLP